MEGKETKELRKVHKKSDFRGKGGKFKLDFRPWHGGRQGGKFK